MNLPNKLSTLRICLVPLFVAAYFLPYWWGAFVAVGLFVIAAFTDFLDGHIARKYNMVTDLGKLLDPIADKVLVCAALICVVATNPLQFADVQADLLYSTPYWVESFNAPYVYWAESFGRIFLTVGSIVILARELLISAMRQIAATKGVVVQANIFGKIKTVCQDVCLPVLIALNATVGVSRAAVLQHATLYLVGWWVGTVTFALAVALTVVSCVIYLVQNKRVFAAND